MADIKSSDARSRNMSAIKGQNTEPEMFVRKGLFAQGYRYRIAPKAVPGHPDLYLAKYRTAIFVNGCFWHRHANCKYAYTPKSSVDFWNTKFHANKNRDEVVRRELSNGKYRQLVIWECAIRFAKKKDNAGRLFETIAKFLNSESSYQEIDQATLND